jgi:hypothetical protein
LQINADMAAKCVAELAEVGKGYTNQAQASELTQEDTPTVTHKAATLSDALRRADSAYLVSSCAPMPCTLACLLALLCLRAHYTRPSSLAAGAGPYFLAIRERSSAIYGYGWIFQASTAAQLLFAAQLAAKDPTEAALWCVASLLSLHVFVFELQRAGGGASSHAPASKQQLHTPLIRHSLCSRHSMLRHS